MAVAEVANAKLREKLAELNVPAAEDLSAYAPAEQFVSAIPISFARQHAIMGFAGGDDGRMIVALGDVEKWQEIDVVSRFLGCATSPLLAPKSAVIAAIYEAYQQRTGQAQAFIENMD